MGAGTADEVDVGVGVVGEDMLDSARVLGLEFLRGVPLEGFLGDGFWRFLKPCSAGTTAAFVCFVCAGEAEGAVLCRDSDGAIV